jgi:hypothetical protein
VFIVVTVVCFGVRVNEHEKKMCVLVVVSVMVVVFKCKKRSDMGGGTNLITHGRRVFSVDFAARLFLLVPLVHDLLPIVGTA